MKPAALAIIAALLLLFGCTGSDGKATGIGSSTALGSDAQIAVGFINPVVTLLNMSTYAIYGTNATFSGNVTAANFNGNVSGSINASNVLNPYWLNATDQRYNESARVDSLNTTKAGLADANVFTNASNTFVNTTYYAWVNPYNPTKYCMWLNASCQICVTGTVSETRC